MEQRPYGMKVVLADDMETAEAKAREALAAEGFGILTEIDVAATLKKKIDVDRPPYKILGACNPPLAHKALEAEPERGVLLPCNVVVYRTGGRTRVSAVAAEQMLGMVGNEELGPVATEVAQRMQRVLDAVAAG